MSDIAWAGDAMAYARAHVMAGVLEIDRDGCIWRLKIWAFGRWRSVMRRRAENVGGKGYLRVSLARPGGLAIVMAHNLVYEVIIAPIPSGLEINHKNLIKSDNRPDNLEPVTGSQNVQHAYDNGRTPPWSYAKEWRKGRARMTDAQIAFARDMRRRGALLKRIAETFGISTTHAHRITGGVRCEKE